ncbi:MAG: glucose-6-phosphate isomerase [Nitratireductor sp.]
MALKSQASNLKADEKRIAKTTIREMFENDNKRFDKFSLSFDTLTFDFSKNRIDEKVLKTLLKVAKEAGVENYRDVMFNGAPINGTENREVLHTALRNLNGEAVMVDGKDVMPDVKAVLRAMGRFTNAVRNGKYEVTGGKVTDVVNIGIGGSDLGPAMAVLALAPYHNGPKCHFVSNVDGADMADTLAKVDPATTLFIVASKTFTTQETMTNANTARQWLKRKLKKKDVGAHFAALSTNLEATREFGIEDDRTFGFWDWVGGRYSLWGAIGLSIMLAIGSKNFQQMLEGAEAIDTHFKTAKLEKNIPVLMALIGIWNRNVLGFTTHAVLPYDNRLARFPAYLQQLDMESNGKRVQVSGKKLKAPSGPIVWGEPGTNGQHAFYQLIHQGTDVIPCDFLIAAKPQEKLGDHHALLVANCFAQSEALMVGKTKEEVVSELEKSGMDVAQIKKLAPHKVFEGNRPSNTFLYEKLDPKTLGMLIALYEHKVHVQGVVWGLNSYDQWGVELGKVLANQLVPMVKGEAKARNKDASTKGLIATFHKMQK